MARRGPPPRPAARPPDARTKDARPKDARPTDARRELPAPARASRLAPGRRPEPAAGSQPAPPVEPDVEEVAFESGGRTWSARVLGRSARSRNAAPLLLLGFFEQGAGAGAQDALEAFAVGRRLADLSEAALADALGRAAPPRTGPKRGFFQDTDQGRGGRREGGPGPGA